jgi:uncharacterized protein YqiB (DUF1249 family)
VSHTIHQSPGRTPLWVYEQNYRVLMQLLRKQLEDNYQSTVHYENKPMVIKASLLESCKYSQVVELEEISAIASNILNGLRLKIRIYHDARVAEVIDYQGHYKIKAKYDYPNHRMYHPDEKRQVNHLLVEWLHLFCSSNASKDKDNVYSE